MNKILIIEDDSRKGDAILTLVREILLDAEVLLARSYQSGLKAIVEQSPDILILDMSIPNYDASPGQRSGKPRPLGGFEIMRKLRRRGVQIRVIVLTQLDHFGDGGQEYNFDELESKCKSEFPFIFVRSIYYAQSSSEWRETLISTIREIRKGSKRDLDSAR